MPKDKKEKAPKRTGSQNPSAHNDQLGENAAEHMSDEYDNKQNKKRK